MVSQSTRQLGSCVRRDLPMAKQNRFTAVVSAVILVSCGALFLGQRVNAAGEGKITGTVKLDGTAPHMKAIDMPKDPYCVKANAASPAHLQPLQVGPTGGSRDNGLH